MAQLSGKKHEQLIQQMKINQLEHEKKRLIELLQPFASFYHDVKHLPQDQKTFVLAQVKAKHIQRAYEYLAVLDVKNVKNIDAA